MDDNDVFGFAFFQKSAAIMPKDWQRFLRKNTLRRDDKRLMMDAVRPLKK